MAATDHGLFNHHVAKRKAGTFAGSKNAESRRLSTHRLFARSPQGEEMSGQPTVVHLCLFTRKAYEHILCISISHGCIRCQRMSTSLYNLDIASLRVKRDRAEGDCWMHIKLCHLVTYNMRNYRLPNSFQ